MPVECPVAVQVSPHERVEVRIGDTSPCSGVESLDQQHSLGLVNNGCSDAIEIHPARVIVPVEFHDVRAARFVIVHKGLDLSSDDVVYS